MSETVKLRMHPAWSAAFVLGGPLIGLIVGAGLGPLSRWLLDHLPFSLWLLQMGARADGRVGLIVLAALGTAIGMGVAHSARQETLSIEFDEAATGAGVILTRDAAPQWVARNAAAAVFRDKKDLVFTGHDGRELARGDVELLEGSRVADAFRTRGWPWRDEDPYAGSFSAWVDGRPLFGDGRRDDEVHRLLRERRQAVKDNKSAPAEDLRRRLGDAGVVVRDRGGHQEIRVLRLGLDKG